MLYIFDGLFDPWREGIPAAFHPVVYLVENRHLSLRLRQVESFFFGGGLYAAYILQERVLDVFFGLSGLYLPAVDEAIILLHVFQRHQHLFDDIPRMRELMRRR